MDIEERIKQKLYTENEYGYKYQDLSVKLTDEEKEYMVEKYGLKTVHMDLGSGKEFEIHDMCINCQARQLFKYWGFVDKTGDKNAGFTVRCNFVPKGLPRGSRSLLKKYMTEKNMDANRALLYLKSAIDPVSWCELMFGFRDDDPNWRLRNYQKEQLRCNSLRLVIREGRRSGKTFAMALKLLYLAFNLLQKKGLDSEGNEIIEGPEIVVITPYQAQVANIFREMENILKRNKDLQGKVTTAKGGTLYVKTPYYKLGLDNGSTISGFVSGVGVKEDGSGGGTMRGQNAGVIYLDEMDMIPEEILLNVIQPLLLTRADVMMIATSTPIGKRGMFYSWCRERPDFKEDYLPSSVLPQWDAIKKEVEAENTEEGFAAEYMAHFIEGAYGVFKPSYIYRARGAYTYADSDIHNYSWWREAAGVKERSELIKVMGIDWNKNAGTEFVVVAYDPAQHHWFVVEATNISAGQWSSVRWKEEVIRLNYKWKPDYIYADEGYGHTIIEDLKLEAHALRVKKGNNKIEQQTTKLLDRLKAFNFSQKVELRSPIDGTLIQKTGKEFLVENAVRVFEEGRIWFPEDDLTLFDQLQHYVILRRHPSNNKPVYGPDNDRIGDHRLDALMLALAGLFLEKSMYSGTMGVQSAPASLTKQFLDKRANTLAEKRLNAADVVKYFNEHVPSLAVDVLELRRGDPATENHIRHVQRAQELVKSSQRGWFSPERGRGSRSDIGRNEGEESVYEYFNRKASSNAGYADDSEALHQVRRMGPQVARRGKVQRRKSIRRR